MSLESAQALWVSGFGAQGVNGGRPCGAEEFMSGFECCDVIEGCVRYTA